MPRSTGATMRGFPALAGMDPRRAARTRPAAGLPRARGDGPSTDHPCRWSVQASPRSRGWTRVARAVPASERGFPALAGMDPERIGGAEKVRRLPRARGDGPQYAAAATRDLPASPRSRGWTLLEIGFLLAVQGFPALAGMDPATSGRPRRHGWLPRARGDGPQGVDPEPRLLEASPRSRGWTELPPPLRQPGRGFPALAGMDLRRRRPGEAR